MTAQNNILILLAGLLAGAAAALILLGAAGTLPAGNATAPTGNTPAAQQVVPVQNSEIRQFGSAAEIPAFVRSHIDGASRASPVPVPVRRGTLPSGTRTWRFDLDTSSFKPDEYLVTAAAVTETAGDSTLFNILESGTRQQAFSKAERAGAQLPSTAGPYIRIDPIGDHFIGDRFTITGITNLSADSEILVQVVSSSFKPTQKSQSAEFSGIGMTIKPSSQPAVSSLSPADSGAGREYSTTNVQVKGVDEADIVKTDGRLICIVSGHLLHLLKAYPAKDAGIVATLKFSGTPQSLYLNGDRLVLISTIAADDEYLRCSKKPCDDQVSPIKLKTRMYIFSIADPANPSLLRELVTDGDYRDSRMIGNILYFVTSSPADPDERSPDFPKVRDSRDGTSEIPVYYFDRNDRVFSLTTVGAVDTAADMPVYGKAFLIGSAGTVYVSPSRLYIAIPSPPQYSGRGEPDTTGIYAFSLDGDRITYAGQGRVDGTLINQYAMDEYNGHLRVATTALTSEGQRGSTASEVSVLDKDLQIMGTVGDIAPTERIYASRFMGDRLYLVTFRETDPLFVIDLSRPAHPTVLGELQMPGFSDYLHPYDATHLIGVGKQSTRGGLKLAFFDVSDVHNPRLVDEEMLGGPGSDSEVLRDPKAFLFDSKKDLLVLPAHIVNQEYRYRGSNSYEIMPELAEWRGAYLFGIDSRTGFVKKGEVIHYRGSGNFGFEVKRSLFIDDTLYTISVNKVVMNDLSDSARLIGEVDLRR